MPDSTPPPIPGAPTPGPAKKGLSPLAWIAIGCGGIILVGAIAVIGLGIFAFRAGQEVVEEATGGRGIGGLVEDFQDNPARVGAETMIRVNPELDLIETDAAAGTITFRNNRTGEEATLNFADIEEGRFSMTTDEGQLSIDASDENAGAVTFSGPEGEVRFGVGAGLDDVPDWVPVYPGASEHQGSYQATAGDGVTGAVTSTTTDSAQAVVGYYTQLFEDAGYSILAESLTRTPDGAFGAVSAELAAEGRTINVGVIEQMPAGGQVAETQIVVNYNTQQ